MNINPENIHHPSVGHEFGIGHTPDTMTINTPTGKKTFKSANHRKTSLSAALTELKTGSGNLGQVVTHWKDISHRTRGLGVKSRFMLPVEYRGSSLTKLDKMVDSFNHKEWANDADLLQDLIALRNEAERHLTSSGKRKLATQTLIDKCNNAIATQLAKTTISRDYILQDLTQHNGAVSKHLLSYTIRLTDGEEVRSQELSLAISKKMTQNEITLSDGLDLMKKFSSPAVFLQDASGYLVEASDGDLTKLTGLLKQVPDKINCQLLNEVTLGVVRQYLTETMDDALSQIPDLLQNSPSTGLLLSKSLEAHIKHGSLDSTIAETPSFFGISNGSVPEERINELKSTPAMVHEFINRILQHPNDFQTMFDNLAEKDPTILITIVKAHIQQTIKAASSQTLTSQIKFLQHLEVTQFNEIANLNHEKETIKAQLKAPHLSQADQQQLSQQKDAISNKINMLERGSFQDAIGEVSHEIIEEINKLNTKSYTERSAMMPGIIAKTNVDPTIQNVLVSASLAMLDRSDHLSDIESDIHTTNQQLFHAHQSTNQQLALNLTQNLAVLNLTSSDGATAYGNHNIPNYHAFNVLKHLISIDSSILDKAATQTALEAACFPRDDDDTFNHQKIATFIEQHLPENAATRQVLELLSTKYMAATNHHMVFDLQDQLPNLPSENSRKRTIALNIDSQNQISIQTSASFESMNGKATEVEASLTAEQTITLPLNGSPTTSFKLGTCVINPSAADNLQAPIENWNGEVVLSQPKTASPLSTILKTHQPTLLQTLETLQNNLTKTATRINTQQNINHLQTIVESIHALPKKDRFQCLNQIEQLAMTIESNLIELNTNGQFQGINMKHLFTSQSIWNSRNYTTYRNQIETILSEVNHARFSGTKLEKSETQQYTIIEGAQGNKYELLTHVSEAEANQLGIAHFLKDKFSHKTGQVEKATLVGQGGFKKIRLARNMATQEIVIVGKSVFFDKSSFDDFENEVKNHLSLSKTSIIQLQDQAILESNIGPKGYTFMTLGKESGETTVETLNDPNSQLSATEKVNQASSISIDLIKGLAEFESIGFIHNDIKPQNFIIDQEGHAHWIDFGTGRNAIPPTENDIARHALMLGTPMYMPRDVTIFGIENFDITESPIKKDAWALGISLYQLWTGQFPFKLESIAQSISVDVLLKNIANAIESNTLDTSGIPKPFNEAINGLLDKNPTTRWSAKKALEFLTPRLASQITDT
ncbi:MAG: protein kinase domain-containing protein [Candidatus Marinamargulisbacteria bacterium]